MSATACPLCGAPVWYAKWRVGAGVAELEPAPSGVLGVFVIDRDGFCREAKDGDRNRMTSHYKTCVETQKRREAAACPGGK